MDSVNSSSSIHAPDSQTKAHRYNMGLVGNCHFSALIDMEANVKWLCWPRFDSSFVFGGLLDDEKGGSFSIKPANDDYKKYQSYIENTNILVTRFETTEGVFEVIDFAPRFYQNERFHRPLMLFRKVRKLSGSPRIKVVCDPRGEYGQIKPQSHLGSNHIRYTGLDEPLRLTTNASLTMIQQEREFYLAHDLYFALSWGIPLEGPLITTFEDFFTRTKQYWHTWVERCTLPQIYQKQVIRSALTLKLHQYEDTGGIIASCTTSLPEIHHEGRNWDYRFCWLRDTYYTLSALNSLGHFEEMEKYAHFIENLNVDSLTNLQPVYCIDGRPEMPEVELPLKGYLGNRPVRIGNEARSQIQHDAYGQIIMAIYALFTDARLVDRSRLSKKALRSVFSHIERTLEQPDNGLWEFRGKKALHSYSLLFHWVGSNACRKIGYLIEDRELVERAQACIVRSTDLLEKCYSEKKKAYAQAVGSDELDASLLQMITLGFFHDKPHEKALAHLRGIQKDLEIEPGFLLRYKHIDDFGPQKSAFLVCSFWYVEALISLGLIDEATKTFNLIFQVQNHLGLMSEDFDIKNLSQWGNFPQTYSHVGLINCAFALDKVTRKPFFLL